MSTRAYAQIAKMSAGIGGTGATSITVQRTRYCPAKLEAKALTASRVGRRRPWRLRMSALRAIIAAISAFHRRAA